MVRGVRTPEEAQALGLGRRLMVRVGALLKQGLEVTPTLLEAARPGTALENFLLDAVLLEKASALSGAHVRQLAAKHVPEQCDAFAVQSVEEERHVLCFAEELEVEDGWDRSETTAAGPTQPAPLAHSSAGALASRGSVSRQEDSEMFSRSEIDRLRFKLVTAAADSERIEALRVLAHVPLPGFEKVETIFLGLEDKSTHVRAEAARLLFVIGIEDDAHESLQALCDAKEDVRMRAAERLIKRMDGGVKDLELGATTVCALAALKAESSPRLTLLLQDVLATCAPALVKTPPRLAELLRASLDKIAAVSNSGASLTAALNVLTSAQRLFKKLVQAAPDMVVPILKTELGKKPNPEVEAFLLRLLLDYSSPLAPTDPELLCQCAQFLARDSKEGRESRAIGMVLVQRGEAALGPIVDAFPNATSAAQKYFLHLLDDICRYRQPSPQARERAAGVVLSAMESGTRGLRMMAMHCRFPTALELSEATREKVARAFLGSLHDFGFPTDLEIAEEGLARMGLPVIRPLTERLAPEFPQPQRIQAARILGHLALHVKSPKGEMQRTTATITEILRCMQALLAEKTFPWRGTLHAAMGKLSASPAATKGAAEVVARTLLQVASTPESLDSTGALEGLTHLAASRRATPQLIATVTGLLRRTVNEIRTDVVARDIEVEGEKVIEIAQGEDLVEKLPVALEGFARIACSSSCPPAFAKDIVRDLTARWRKIVSGDLIWGPGNAILAVRALQDIGMHSGLDSNLRMEILKALAPRVAQIPVLQAMSRILQADDTLATAPAALSFGHNVVGRRKPDGRYDSEDRPDLLAALARVAARTHLGVPGEQGVEKARVFRAQVVTDLFQGAIDHVPGAFEGLVQIRVAKVLPKHEQEAFEMRIADFHAIAVVP